jgi:hypothetical protein
MVPNLLFNAKRPRDRSLALCCACLQQSPNLWKWSWKLDLGAIVQHVPHGFFLRGVAGSVNKREQWFCSTKPWFLA